MKRQHFLMPMLIVSCFFSACGQPDDDRSMTTARAAAPAGTPTILATVFAPDPTVDIGIPINASEMVDAALGYAAWREAIVSGDPVTLLAIPGTPHSIHQLGLNIGNWDPACQRPLYLVILEGDFSGENLFSGPTDGSELRGRYLALVFDLTAGIPGDVTFTILSTDGAAFKQALGDPSLPDFMDLIPDPQPPYPPCEDVTLEGNPEPQPTP